MSGDRPEERLFELTGYAERKLEDLLDALDELWREAAAIRDHALEGEPDRSVHDDAEVRDDAPDETVRSLFGGVSQVRRLESLAYRQGRGQVRLLVEGLIQYWVPWGRGDGGLEGPGSDTDDDEWRRVERRVTDQEV